jgi:hypothetical protein
MKYTVLKPLYHEGKDYRAGDEIDIDGREDQIEAHLLETGAIAEIEAEAKPAKGKKGQAEAENVPAS